jgi:hypothetical protein
MKGVEEITKRGLDPTSLGGASSRNGKHLKALTHILTLPSTAPHSTLSHFTPPHLPYTLPSPYFTTHFTPHIYHSLSVPLPNPMSISPLAHASPPWSCHHLCYISKATPPPKLVVAFGKIDLLLYHCIISKLDTEDFGVPLVLMLCVDA